MARKTSKVRLGFTLIELMIVISIIGLLSSIILASLNTTRVKARDARRIQDIRQIQNAIEMYALDHNGQYPGYLSGQNTFTRSVASVNEGNDGCGYGSPGTSGDSNSNYMPGIWCRFQTALSPYIAELPKTTQVGSGYFYFTYKVPVFNLLYNPNGVRMYGLGVRLERANSASKNDGGYYDDWFELGELPTYCKAQSIASAQNWSAWSSNPCSCATYYSIGCGY